MEGTKRCYYNCIKIIRRIYWQTEAEGALVLKEVKYINNKWTGIVMNPKENLVAKCELLLEEKALKIIAKKGLLYKTIVWTKL